ncbi:DUF2799 domain-containing protein [Mesorhizobium sp. CAU 1741]|uniref:DUF2799 domain-containing protein n=1 Tax=Mesorhizobium sp. CAU 1741 TaxID=3140366 RepID=UPI00325B4B50
MSNHLSLLRALASACMGLVMLTSCATLNQEECLNANWFELGQQDGAAGRAQTHVNEHRSACGEHGLPVDEPQWRTGWEQGIRLYCTPENGLQQGRQGSYYANSCPIELATGFEAAYSVAKALHDARMSRETLQRELDSLETSLRDAQKPEDRQRIERDISDKRAYLRTAERRVWDAEGDYDIYVSSQGLMSRR